MSNDCICTSSSTDGNSPRCDAWHHSTQPFATIIYESVESIIEGMADVTNALSFNYEGTVRQSLSPNGRELVQE